MEKVELIKDHPSIAPITNFSRYWTRALKRFSEKPNDPKFQKFKTGLDRLSPGLSEMWQNREDAEFANLALSMFLSSISSIRKNI